MEFHETYLSFTIIDNNPRNAIGNEGISVKRSSKVSLALLGAAAAGMLGGCDEQPKAYPDVDACIKSHDYTEQECRASFDKALADYNTSAPHFTDQASCAAQYGAEGCRPMEGGGGFFVPMMMGYMIGHSLSQPLFRNGNCGGGFNQNCGYVSHGGAAFTGYNYTAAGGRSSGSTYAGEAVSRGGLGASGHATGGAGE
jgi:uncharacterized protein YgiB involved in biofilm formation